jgi:hypothetical protein
LPFADQKTNSEWEHIYVFPIHKTSSQDLSEGLKRFALEEELLDVFDELLIQLLEKITPKLIAVANAKASHLLHERWGTKIGALDNNKCYYPLLHRDKITSRFILRPAD